VTNVCGSAKKHTFYSSSPLPSYDRSSEQSIVSNLLAVEQRRSPHILPESRAFKILSPQISPTTREEILLQSPHKVLVYPHISPGSLGEADNKCITLRSRAHGKKVQSSPCLLTCSHVIYHMCHMLNYVISVPVYWP